MVEMLQDFPFWIGLAMALAAFYVPTRVQSWAYVIAGAVVFVVTGSCYFLLFALFFGWVEARGGVIAVLSLGRAK